jgi:hypothetical protein
LDNTDNIKKQIITICIGCSIFFILDLFFWILNIFDYSFIEYNGIFDLIFSLIIYSLFWSICKSSSKSTIICFSIIFIVGIINQVKFKISGEPLYLSDIHFLGKIGDFFYLIFSNISLKIILKAILVFVIYFLVLLAIYKLSKKNDIKFENFKIRILIIIIDILLLLILFIPNAMTKNIFLKLFFKNNNIADYSSYGTTFHYYMYYGCTTGMYGTYLNNYFFKPDNYDEDSLNTELENASKIETENILGTPNIVVIFSESFFDVDLLSEEVEFNTPITSNFNALKEKGYLVNLISPTYGGLSENSAFELLTGGTLNYFPQGYIPIVSLYNRNNTSSMPSLVKVLKENGYITKTTFVQDFYSSEKSYTKMGFDEYVELYQKNNITYNDKYVTHLIKKDLQNNSQKLFSVYSMYEGHMPYQQSKFDDYNVNIIKSNLTEEENETLKVYAQGIYNSDKQLGEIYEYIQTINEPTILLFLSDHLPFIYSSDYTNVLSSLDYFNTSSEEENYYRIFNTQALVLSNYDISNLNMPNYLGVDILLTYLVNRMDVKLPNYYKWLESTTNILAASNKYISMDLNGNLIKTSNLLNEQQRIFELKNMMMYKMFICNN